MDFSSTRLQLIVGALSIAAVVGGTMVKTPLPFYLAGGAGLLFVSIGVGRSLMSDMAADSPEESPGESIAIGEFSGSLEWETDRGVSQYYDVSGTQLSPAGATVLCALPVQAGVGVVIRVQAHGLVGVGRVSGCMLDSRSGKHRISVKFQSLRHLPASNRT
jgi:hypothetical protein